MIKPAYKNPIRIFLDLDGVLADFEGELPADKYTADGHVKWDEFDHEWWAKQPICPGAKEFYDAAKKMGKVKFLTAPMLNVDSYTGKVEWIQNFVPERGKFILRDMILCPARDKFLLARPDRILVDDREKNIAQWTAAGGIGILHKGDFKATMKALELAVEKLEITKQKPRRRTPAPKTDAPAVPKKPAP
jgi:hypothetical protein